MASKPLTLETQLAGESVTNVGTGALRSGNGISVPRIPEYSIESIEPSAAPVLLPPHHCKVKKLSKAKSSTPSIKRSRQPAKHTNHLPIVDTPEGPEGNMSSDVGIRLRSKEKRPPSDDLKCEFDFRGSSDDESDEIVSDDDSKNLTNGARFCQ